MSPIPNRPMGAASLRLVVSHGVANPSTWRSCTGVPSWLTQRSVGPRTSRTCDASTSSAFWTISDMPCNLSLEMRSAFSRAASSTSEMIPGSPLKCSPKRRTAAWASRTLLGSKAGVASPFGALNSWSAASSARPIRRLTLVNPSPISNQYVSSCALDCAVLWEPDASPLIYADQHPICNQVILWHGSLECALVGPILGFMPARAELAVKLYRRTG